MVLKSNEEEEHSKLQDKRSKNKKPKYKLGLLVRTADNLKNSPKEILQSGRINYIQ